MVYDGPALPPPIAYPPASGRSSAAITLGVIGLVSNVVSCCCCLGVIPGLLSPVAWWMGAAELRAIRGGLASQQGEGNARAGRICGMVGTGILVLYVGVLAVYVAVVGLAAASQALSKGHIPVR